MSMHQVGMRYANALFNLAHSKEERKENLVALEHVKNLILKTPHLKNFFFSSQITKEEKKSALQNSLQGHVSPTLLNSLLYILDKGRFVYLADIVRAYRRKVYQDLDLLEAKLIFAKTPQPKTADHLKNRLEKAFGKNITFKEKIDPKLIGGGILFLENRMVDFSVKGKLDRLKDTLLSAHI